MVIFHIDDMCESRERDRGPDPGPPPLPAIDFITNSGLKPLKNHKAFKRLDHHRPASITPLNSVSLTCPMMAHLKWYLGSLFSQKLKKLPELLPSDHPLSGCEEVPTTYSKMASLKSKISNIFFSVHGHVYSMCFKEKSN